jgi:hypothetical protein
MGEIASLRQENTKTFDEGSGKRRLEAHIGAIHYKDDYTSKIEFWKDIDLTWQDNKITKAPYELTLEGNKVTIRGKKTGEISTIELLDIGSKGIPDKDWEKSKGLAKAPGIVNLDNIALDTDLEIVAENGRVKFTRILKSDKAPTDAQFKVTGNFIVKAQDSDGDLPVEVALKDGILTETLKPDRAVKYPVRIDPTWQVGASTDDCYRNYVGGSEFATNDSNIRAGYDNAFAQGWGGAARFLNVGIPAGATITLANLILTCQTAHALTIVNTCLRAERSINPVTFSDSTDFDARTWTTAYINWDAIPAWTLNTEYTSPSDDGTRYFKDILQEVIDLPGWASGNPVVILWDDFQKRSTQVSSTVRYAYSYDGSTTKAPKLVVTYTTPIPKVPKGSSWWAINHLRG